MSTYSDSRKLIVIFKIIQNLTRKFGGKTFPGSFFNLFDSGSQINTWNVLTAFLYWLFINNSELIKGVNFGVIEAVNCS